MLVLLWWIWPNCQRQQLGDQRICGRVVVALLKLLVSVMFQAPDGNVTHLLASQSVCNGTAAAGVASLSCLGQLR